MVELYTRISDFYSQPLQITMKQERRLTGRKASVIPVFMLEKYDVNFFWGGHPLSFCVKESKTEQVNKNRFIRLPCCGLVFIMNTVL